MDMNDFVNIVGLLAMVITWFIVAPLKNAIQSLERVVDKLSDSLEDRRKELTDLGKQVESNKRGLKDLNEQFQHFCDNCKCHKG